MERDELQAVLRRLPKVELHRHVEGAMRPSTLLELGRRRNVDLPLDDVDTLTPHISWTEGEPRSLAYFLTKFHANWYQSYADVERIVTEAIEDAAREGIIHLELRFSPEHFARNSGLDPLGVMDAFCERGAQAAAENRIGVCYLLTFTRERYDPDLWKRVIDHGVDLHEQGIVGADLAGDEFKYPNEDFEKHFRRVKDTGVLGTTIHAGEGTNAAQVASAVNLLGANRIGHGFSALEDERVVQLLVERGITLEMCPISNYQTGCIDDLADHSLPALRAAGVRTTLNTDDPTIHGTSLCDDYVVAHKHWGFTLDDLREMDLNAARATFLEPEAQRRLIEQVEAGYAQVAAEE